MCSIVDIIFFSFLYTHEQEPHYTRLKSYLCRVDYEWPLGLDLQPWCFLRETAQQAVKYVNTFLKPGSPAQRLNEKIHVWYLTLHSGYV